MSQPKQLETIFEYTRDDGKKVPVQCDEHCNLYVNSHRVVTKNIIQLAGFEFWFALITTACIFFQTLFAAFTFFTK